MGGGGGGGNTGHGTIYIYVDTNLIEKQKGNVQLL